MYLYGASGHAKVVADILLENNILIEGVYDDDEKINSFKDFPFLGIYSKVENTNEFIICIGNNSCRNKIAKRINVKWGKAISKFSNISTGSSIGEGTVIMNGVNVNADAIIGNHVILNTNCSVDHDCRVDNFVHICPNVALAGNVYIGEGTQIGIGACVIPGIRIGKWATIGAGAVIIKDVPDNAVVVGNPGKIIKYNNCQL